MNNLILCIGICAAALTVVSCGDDHMTDDGSTEPTSVPIPSIDYDALWVVNGESNSISIINTETESVAETIRLQNVEYPHHIYMSGDRATMVLAVPGTDLSGGHGHGHSHGEMKGAVMVLDALTGATRKARMCDMSNHNATYSPNGREIWTCQTASSGTVLVLDPVTLGTKQTIPVGDSPLEITFGSDGRYAFVVNNGSDNVTVIDAASKAVVKTIAVGDGPVGAWPGSNNVMYVDNETGKSLTAIDASTLEVIRTYNLGFTPAMAAIGPDGALWVTDVDNGRVAFYAVDSDQNLGDLATGRGAHAIAFSGDGKRAYITNQEVGTVSVIDVAARSVVKNLNVGAKPNGLMWRAR